jgi:hypothetical protein
VFGRSPLNCRNGTWSPSWEDLQKWAIPDTENAENPTISSVLRPEESPFPENPTFPICGTIKGRYEKVYRHLRSEWQAKDYEDSIFKNRRRSQAWRIEKKYQFTETKGPYSKSPLQWRVDKAWCTVPFLSEIEGILREAHQTDDSNRHLSYRPMLKKLKRMEVCWYGVSRAVKKYAEDCQVCCSLSRRQVFGMDTRDMLFDEGPNWF